MNKRDVYKNRMELLKADIKDKYSNKKFVEQRLQPDGSVKIDVNLPEESELFDPMAPEKYNQLNPEILQYIDNQTYFVPAQYNITVNFVGRELSDSQQKRVEEALHDHYNMQVYDKLDDIKSNRALGIFLMIFGVVALAAYFFITMFAENVVFHEVVSIVGTFAIWEAVDCWLINGHHTKVELNNALQMAMLKVKFNGKDAAASVQKQA